MRLIDLLQAAVWALVVYIMFTAYKNTQVAYFALFIAGVTVITVARLESSRGLFLVEISLGVGVIAALGGVVVQPQSQAANWATGLAICLLVFNLLPISGAIGHKAEQVHRTISRL